MTTSPITDGPRSLSDQEVLDWLDVIERRAHKRALVHSLSQQCGIGRPLALARRFQLKVREIGFQQTVAAVRARAASRLRKGRA